MHTVRWSNSSIWLIDGTLSSVTTPSQSGRGSNGNDGILHVPQSSRIEASSSDCVVSYPGHSLGVGVLPLCRDAVSVFYSPIRLTYINSGAARSALGSWYELLLTYKMAPTITSANSPVLSYNPFLTPLRHYTDWHQMENGSKANIRRYNPFQRSQIQRFMASVGLWDIHRWKNFWKVWCVFVLFLFLFFLGGGM